MTGVDIIGALLNEAPAGPVPADRIRAGALPDNIDLPALLVRLVSSNERQPLTRGPKVRAADRVSVTVRANSYEEQRAVIAWAKARCAGRIVDVPGAGKASVLTAGTGPDLLGPAGSFEQTQDFKVSFDA